MEWKGKQFGTHYFALKTQYEHAKLASKFSRYSINVGWVFNRLLYNLEAGFYAGVGMIHRDKKLKLGGLPTYSITGELTYPIFKKTRIGLKYEIVRRSDLKVMWNETKLFKPNFSIGLKYQIIN